MKCRQPARASAPARNLRCAAATTGYCVLLLVSNLPADVAARPLSSGTPILRYDFDVGLQRNTDEITVAETITLAPLGPKTALTLDLCGTSAIPTTDPKASDPCVRAPSEHGPQVVASTISRPGMTVTAATIDGRPVSFSQSSNAVTIDLPPSPDTRRASTLVLYYRGRPRLGLFIGRTKYGQRYFATVPWPDLNHHWLALVDDISSKTPVSMAITAPSEYQVISNGVLRQQVDLPNGMRRSTWAEESPIPVWQFSLVASAYAVDRLGEYRGVELTAWSLPEESKTARRTFAEVTRPALEFFSEHIGPYPYEKLAQIQAPMAGGGLELASNILYGFEGTPDPAVVAHEIAHQWFGDAVTEADWNDVWLSEGFATYFALLYLEHAKGHDAFVDAVRKSAKGALDYARAHPGSTIAHRDLANVSQVIANQPQIYQGGAQVLHMLRHLVGDEVFWRGIQLYYERFRDRHAGSADFRRAMEDACAAGPDCYPESRDLRWFFDQWLRRGDVPTLEGTWSYDAAAKQVRITLEQKQLGAPFRLPVEFAIVDPDAPSGAEAPASLRVLMGSHRVSLEFPAMREPAQVLIDPRTALTLVEKRFGRAAVP